MRMKSTDGGTGRFLAGKQPQRDTSCRFPSTPDRADSGCATAPPTEIRRCPAGDHPKQRSQKCRQRAWPGPVVFPVHSQLAKTFRFAVSSNGFLRGLLLRYSMSMVPAARPCRPACATCGSPTPRRARLDEIKPDLQAGFARRKVGRHFSRDHVTADSFRFQLLRRQITRQKVMVAVCKRSPGPFRWTNSL